MKKCSNNAPDYYLLDFKTRNFTPKMVKKLTEKSAEVYKEFQDIQKEFWN